MDVDILTSDLRLIIYGNVHLELTGRGFDEWIWRLFNIHNAFYVPSGMYILTYERYAHWSSQYQNYLGLDFRANVIRSPPRGARWGMTRKMSRFFFSMMLSCIGTRFENFPAFFQFSRFHSLPALETWKSLQLQVIHHVSIPKQPEHGIYTPTCTPTFVPWQKVSQFDIGNYKYPYRFYTDSESGVMFMTFTAKSPQQPSWQVVKRVKTP